MRLRLLRGFMLSCTALLALIACAAGEVRRLSVSSGATPLAEHVPRALIANAEAWRAYPINGVRKDLELRIEDLTTTRWRVRTQTGADLEQDQAIADPQVRLFGEGGASGAFAAVDFDPTAEPVLLWEWAQRVTGSAHQPLALMVGFEIPESEASPETLAWAKQTEEEHGVRPPLRAIGYVFGGYTSATVAESAFFAPSSVFLINVRPRIDCDGVWRNEARDVASDYRAIFKAEPPRVSALALVGDSRGEANALEARLRRVAVTTGSNFEREEKLAQFVKPELHPLWYWVAGVAAVVCVLSGAWLFIRFVVVKSDRDEDEQLSVFE